MAAPLDLITFDTSGLAFHGDKGGARVWHNTAGDGIGLYFFPIPPDIGADPTDKERLRERFRNTASAEGFAIIEIDTATIEGCPAIRTIFKVPQQPKGMTYIGAITLPFRDFSYVLKVQCEERGITGLRESVILDKLLSEGEVSISSAGDLGGWSQDPYNASIRTKPMMNRAEATEYDNLFPNHPLSRARVALGHIEKTLAIAPQVRGKPTFEYKKPRMKPKPWWKWT